MFWQFQYSINKFPSINQGMPSSFSSITERRATHISPSPIHTPDKIKAIADANKA